MAKYYRYKTVDDLTTDAARIGHSIQLSDDFLPLFQPIKVAHKTVGNRLAIQPMEGCDCTHDGHPGELTFRRYHRFGSGGAKIIWGEATAILPEARMNPRQLIINKKTLPDITRMIAACRETHQKEFGTSDDLLIGLQLTHSGRYSFQKPLIVTHDPLLDQLTIDKSTGKRIDSSYPLLSDDDLKKIENQYVAAAILCDQAGVDFIDLKQCHRYLLSELLASTNRSGKYGGSLENRTRLIRNIVTRIREEVPCLIIATRMNAYDGIPHQGEGEKFVGVPVSHQYPLEVAFGTDINNHLKEDLTEPIQVAQQLEKWGVSLLNISAGNPYANPHVLRPAEYPPMEGYNAPEHPLLGVLRHFRIAKAIQKAVPNTPVIGSAYSWLQDFSMHAAAANVAQGDIAIVGMGRATLSHPDFAKTLKEEGQMKRKKICRTFSYCTDLMRTKDHPLGQYETGCPPFDKEPYQALWKEAKEKRKSPQGND